MTLCYHVYMIWNIFVSEISYLSRCSGVTPWWLLLPKIDLQREDAELWKKMPCENFQWYREVSTCTSSLMCLNGFCTWVRWKRTNFELRTGFWGGICGDKREFDNERCWACKRAYLTKKHTAKLLHLQWLWVKFIPERDKKVEVLDLELIVEGVHVEIWEKLNIETCWECSEAYYSI